MPVAVDEATVNVATDEPEPGAAMDAGLNATVTPVGWPVAVRATAELNPFKAPVVMVEDPLLPCTTETAPGEAEMLKAGVVDGGPASEAISPLPFGLPQPVAKS